MKQYNTQRHNTSSRKRKKNIIRGTNGEHQNGNNTIHNVNTLTTGTEENVIQKNNIFKTPTQQAHKILTNKDKTTTTTKPQATQNIKQT